MNFVMSYTLNKILLHVQTFPGRKRKLCGDQPFSGQGQQPLLSVKHFPPGEEPPLDLVDRHRGHPRDLTRHSSPILDTCLIKTFMLPF